MKTILSFLLSALCAISATAADHMILAEDDASDAAYKDGWKNDAGGIGFGSWTFQTLATPNTQSYAGTFIADPAHNGDLKGVALHDKAFGLFANGIAFEIADAFRSFKKPLAVGQTFSILIGHGELVKKFEQDDPAPGSIGFTLRTGTASGAVEDYNKGARFEFGCYADKKTYQIYDGEEQHDTGIPLTSGGLSISVTLVTPDTYDLEVTTLATKGKTTLSGRKLGGEAAGKVESFCIFNRNGEKDDAFFNGFQVTGLGE